VVAGIRSRRWSGFRGSDALPLGQRRDPSQQVRAQRGRWRDGNQTVGEVRDGVVVVVGDGLPLRVLGERVGEATLIGFRQRTEGMGPRARRIPARSCC